MTVKTTCCYCGVGCGIEATLDRAGHLSVKGDPDNPVNRGKLCSKGLNLHTTASDRRNRLETPMMRSSRGAPLRRVSWDEALERIAAVFRTLTARFGPDSVAFYGSGQFLTEEYYVLNKLVKGFLGTNNLDTNSRLCMSSAVAAYKIALGEDLVPVSYDDIELADCFLVAGANPAWCHPILFRRLEAHKDADSRVKLIVVDPRRTQTAAVADLHLAVRPGTDTVLHNALARLLIEEGFVDQNFVRGHTEGFDELRELVLKTTVRDAASACGVDEADLKLAARWIGESRGFMTLWAMGLNQSAAGVDKNLSLINLNLITGQIGRPGAGPLSLTGQPNAMGGREVGGMANLSSAHRSLSNPEHREEIARHWGVPSIPERPGLTATEFFPALLDGRLKALWVACTDPLVSQPDVRAVEKALVKAPFVVVQDMSSLNHVIDFADVVLPAATWLEKVGTMTNSDRRVSYLAQLLEPPGEALPDAEIFCRFAHKMGWGKSFDYASAAEIYDEHAALTVGTNVDVGGVSHLRLRQEGTLQWPVPSASSPGTPRLFTDGVFATPTGRAKLSSVSHEDRSEPTDAEFPLVLTTGRVRDQWHTRSRSGKVNRLNQHKPAPYLEIHPDDAHRWKVEDGKPVVVKGRRGEVRVTAQLTPDIRVGVVFLPMHWGRAFGHDLERANNLTSPRLDPVSKEPDFKFAAVKVEPFTPPVRRYAVIGAGAGSARFVQQLRDSGLQGPITVFSREVQPFYSRVLLPEWLAGRKTWDELQKIDPERLRSLDLGLHTGVDVVCIDPLRKTLRDSLGRVHEWDVLVLATGSRPQKPSAAPEWEGVTTLRTRGDAEVLRERLLPGDPVVVVGGGVLGLELADALKAKGCRVRIVHRGLRLMDKQMDAQAAALLAEEVRDRGIDLYMGDEVRSVVGQGRVVEVRLASGLLLDCAALIYAIGTRPNVELALEAGLACGRGVAVNSFLQTSNPDVFAIGEVAELQGRSWGITAAAEEQADACVRYLAGDLSRPYLGSVDVSLLKMEGLTLASLGRIEAEEGDEGVEEILVHDRASRYYKRCLVQNDRLIGALFLGDKTEFLPFKHWIETGLELSDDRKTLLRTGAGEVRRPVRGALVCTCAQVGADDLKDLVAEGCHDAAELGRKTGAGTVCGSCRPDLQRLVAAGVPQ